MEVIINLLFGMWSNFVFFNDNYRFHRICSPLGSNVFLGRNRNN